MNCIALERAVNRYAVSQMPNGLCPAGRGRNICRVVSSYNTSFVPGTFSVHLAASAKASSTVQPLLMMTPDHDPEFVILPCPATAKLEASRNAIVSVQMCFAMLHSLRITRAPHEAEFMFGLRITYHL